MTHAEIEYYVRKGRAERSKAFHASARALRQALVRAVARIADGFDYLHQPTAYR